MSNSIELPNLPNVSVLYGTDFAVVVNTGVTRKATVQQLKDFVIGNLSAGIFPNAAIEVDASGRIVSIQAGGGVAIDASQITTGTLDNARLSALVGLTNAAKTWSAVQTFTLAPVFTDASGSRTALGGSAMGQLLFTLAANSASAKWLRINADNTITPRTASETLSDLAAAPLASPAFTGVPTAPTATFGTNSTQLATCAFVIANAGGGGGSGVWGAITGTLTDQTDLVSALALKAPLASPTFTGVPAAPTASPGTNTTQIATTAFVLANQGLTNLDTQNYIVVIPSSNPAANGTALLAAYAAARVLTPNGNALSATNRSVLIIPPGVYDLGTGSLTLDIEFVDVVGWTGDAAQVFVTSATSTSNTGTIIQTANDVRVSNLTADFTGSTVLSDATDPAAYMPTTTGLAATVWTNVIFSAIPFTGNAMRQQTVYAGTFISCVCGDNGFGGGGPPSEATGTFIDCVSGDFSFSGLGASGTFLRCKAGAYSFGGGSDATGSFKNCVGGDGSFGGGGGNCSGTFKDCVGTDFAFGGDAGSCSGTLEGCVGGQFAYGGNSGTLTGKLFYCRITTGTIPTVSGGGKVVHCINVSTAAANQ
jgi:hypothetical protein